MGPDTPFTVLALGGMSPLSQIARIREGLSLLPGVILTEHFGEADLVYCNDAGTYEEALEAKDDGRLKAGVRLVFNVLDIPEMLFAPLGDYTHEKLLHLRDCLNKADAVTSISPFVQNQLHRLLAIQSTVIWQPVKDVSPTKRLAGEKPFPYRVLMAGRCRDKNKRIGSIGIPSLIMAGFGPEEVAICGGEYPGWGVDLGIVSDEVLNDLYNSVDFVMHPSLNEGLGLVPLEGMICGATPILTYDTSTFSDIAHFPQYWGCYPSPTSVAYRLRALMDNPGMVMAEREYCLMRGPLIEEQFGKETIAENIVDVYRKLVP